MKKDYTPPRCKALLITTSDDVAVGLSTSNFVPENQQLSKKSLFTDDDDDSEESASLWTDDVENNK